MTTLVIGYLKLELLVVLCSIWSDIAARMAMVEVIEGAATARVVRQ